MRTIKFTFPFFLAFIYLSFTPAKLVANTSVASADLTGTWVMSGIETNDVIEIYMSKSRMESLEDAKAKKEEMVTIPLKKVLMRELSIGNTKFVFKNGSFDFYRSASLTFSGKWSLSSDQLILKYSSSKSDKAKQEESVKENKILKLTDKLLVLESESHGKMVTFTFVKK